MLERVRHRRTRRPRHGGTRSGRLGRPQLLSEAYTCYLTDAPFAIQYPYVHRSSTNTLFNVATVSFDRLAREGLAALEERTSDIREAFDLETPMAGTASNTP